MPRRLPVWLSLSIAGLAIILQGCAHQRAAVPEDGAALFAKKCAECHQEDPDNDMRAPTPQALRLMSRSAILASLETGRMRWEAKFLSKAKKTAIANYLGAPDVTLPAVMAGLCPRGPRSAGESSGMGGVGRRSAE